MVLWFLAVVVCLLGRTKGYYLDQANYMYVNTSFNRQVLVVSLCFNLDSPAIAQITSFILFPEGNHSIFVNLSTQGKVSILPKIYQDNIGVNTYTEGEYWFAMKFSIFSLVDVFELITVTIEKNGKIKSIEMLMPLFGLPLSSLPLSERNSLYSCGDVLVSYLEQTQYYDMFVFGKKDSFLEPEARPRWGFVKHQKDMKYMRRKNVKTEKVVLQIEGGNCHFDMKEPHEPRNLQGKHSFGISEAINLLAKHVPVVVSGIDL